MPFDWFLALRFLKEGRAQTGLILAGVAVGVGVIVFLSALISGLQATLVKQTLGSQAHIVVRPPDEEPRLLASGLLAVRRERSPQRVQSIDQWPQVLAAVAQVPDVTAAAPTVNGSAFASRGIAVKAVSLRGVDADSYDRIVSIREKLHGGAFRLAGGEAVVGVELAKDLGLSVGDKLRLTTVDDSGNGMSTNSSTSSSSGGGGSRGGVGGMGAMSSDSGANSRGDVFTVAGIFDLGNKDVNQRWVFVPLKSAQSLLDLPGAISTIEVRVQDHFAADAVARDIRDRTGLNADSWTVLNKSLLIGLRSQNASSYMIQVFIVIAVALGIASVLVVSVVQKSREIGILKAVGTSTPQIRRIFLIQGAVLGLGGSLVGCGLGTVLAMLFASLAKNPDGSPTFPVDLNATLFITASVVATVTGIISAAAPAARAAKLDPAEAIHA